MDKSSLIIAVEFKNIGEPWEHQAIHWQMKKKKTS